MNHLRTVLLLIVALACVPAVAQQDLPDDREAYSLIVLTADQPTQADQQLLSWLQTGPKLRAIVAQTAVHHFKPSNPLYRERYASALPPTQLPAIALCRADGGVIYKASAQNIPGSAKELGDNIQYYGWLDRSLRSNPVAQSWDDCPDGNCPNVQPQPANPSRPWLRPLQPDGVLHPDTWIPDTVQPQVNVNVGGNAIAWGAVALLVVLVVFAGSAGLILIFKD